MKEHPQCQTVRQSMRDGGFEAVIACDQPGGKMTAPITGSFDATTFPANTVVEVIGSQAMKMTMTTAAERVGECTQR